MAGRRRHPPNTALRLIPPAPGTARGWAEARAGEVHRRYRQFVAEGLPAGRRADLQGGGLRRSAGDGAGLAALRRGRARWAVDERVLGSGPFVDRRLWRVLV